MHLVRNKSRSRPRPDSTRQQKTGRTPHPLFYGVFALLLATNAITGVALYLAPEIEAAFRNDNSSILTAYEQRIVQLRLEVDRLHSRQYAQLGDMNLQMHELVQQQEVLFEQQEYVRALADLARQMGVSPSSPAAPVAETGEEPHPAPGDVADFANILIDMQEETRQTLVALSDAATLSTNEIIGQLGAIGITPPATEAPAIGGPFIAPGGELSIVDEANAVAEALTAFRDAKAALTAAPIRQPVLGTMRISSNFGNRTDPFLGRTAFHSGMDFPVSVGTAIHAAAAGKVIAAEYNGGYGRMIDIDHGNGFVTRYAHLSQIGVSVGDTVTSGQRVGASGSTGRSTGPHLHFEVRKANAPLNPSRFLDAGRALARFL